jgi:hypothetical protein
VSDSAVPAITAATIATTAMPATQPTRNATLVRPARGGQQHEDGGDHGYGADRDADGEGEQVPDERTHEAGQAIGWTSGRL